MDTIKINKRLILSGLMLGTLLLAGCMTDNDTKSETKITGLKMTPASIKAGQSADVEGILTSVKALTAINISVWKGTTNVTTGMGFIVAIGTLPDAKTAWSLKTDGNAQISVGGAAATGDYSVKVVAMAGTDSAVATVTLTVTGTPVMTEELTLGSNQNVLGGSVDLDNLKTYTHASAKAISDKIDLYYAHSILLEDKLFAPAQAKISGFGLTTNGPATWPTANATEFRKLSLSESAFSAISTQEAIDALWAIALPVLGGSDQVLEGSTYIVNTDMAKKVLIRVTAYVAGDAGTITVKSTK